MRETMKPFERISGWPFSFAHAVRPRLCFIAYRQIREFATQVVAEYADRADIEVVDASFDEAVAVAHDRLSRGAVDAFVSAGSNAHILRSSIQTPVAVIQMTGFDMLQALMRARELSHRVGIVTYGEKIPQLESVKELLNIQVSQYAYTTPRDARDCFELLRAEGCDVIVGSSLVVDLAEQAGLRGLLAYSLASIRKGFDDAIELARVSRLEASRYEPLQAVLDNLQEAVVAVDAEDRVIAANPPLRRLLDKRLDELLGQPLHAIEPVMSLGSTVASGVEERAVVLQIQHRDWVANRSPIRARGEIIGAALTLYDASAIHKADTSLRIQQGRRQQGVRHRFDDLVGGHGGLAGAVERARRFARTDTTVLIIGESGVGKELFAQSIHAESARSARSFIAINCAAFTESLLESELFGYEEGAFTGSRRGGKPGVFEAAHTGTLFLDEIGDMPLSLQTRLLRVLQEREITRLGSTSRIPVDVRIIAATHQPLKEMAMAGRFRKDLYYRIHVLSLEIPPLRERPGDIEPLSMALLERQLRRLGSRLDPGQVLAPVLPALRGYAWPGNVRELENLLERLSVFLAQFDRAEDIAYDRLCHECPELYEGDAAAGEVQTLEQRVRHALQASQGNRLVAAERLGVSRSTLWRWMRDLNIVSS